VDADEDQCTRYWCGNGSRWCYVQEHLACFLPATLVLGVIHGLDKSHLVMAANLTRTCYAMYQQSATGLSPDIVSMNVDLHEGKDIFIRVTSIFLISWCYTLVLFCHCILQLHMYFVIPVLCESNFLSWFTAWLICSHTLHCHMTFCLCISTKQEA